MPRCCSTSRACSTVFPTKLSLMATDSSVAEALTQDQLTATQALVDSKLLVLAGAGTGKTHVLVERIRHLVDSGDLAPGRELLVLSFTRAVVAELKRRLALSTGR